MSHDICKIKSIAVEPSSHTFSIPGATSTFVANVSSTNNQRIRSTPSYSWTWVWIPESANNPLFDVPIADTPNNLDTIQIGARNIEGNWPALAMATVTRDGNSTVNLPTFSGPFDLYADFCNNPWPARSGDDTIPYFPDATYNFRFKYCADAGVMGTTTDDLPVINLSYDEQRPSIGLPASQDVLRKYLFFSAKNDDVFGIQIFENSFNLLFNTLSSHKIIIGLSRHSKAIGYRDTMGSQLTIHFSQRSVFPPDFGYIFISNFTKPQNKFFFFGHKI